MSKFSEIAQVAGGLIVICIALLFCLLIAKASVGAYRGFHNWVTVTPAERAATDKRIAEENAAWAKDPTKPAVIAQKCIDRGGTPIVSSWDGRIRRCDGVDNKSVNIEVNQ